MALFDQWPYVNIHELNTDWLVKAVKAVKDLAESLKEKTDTIDDSVERAQESAANAKISEDNAKDYYDMTSVLVGKPLSAETLSDMTDTTTIYVYTGSEPGMSAGDWYYYDGANWVSGGIWGAEGSMNSNARNILQYILERVAYTEPGMQVYVDALYQALAPSSSVPTTYTITNALDHVNTSNSATGANNGDSYTATLTAETGYRLSTVTVTMGGTDITSAAYNNGVITIASVTGNIVITASAIVDVPDTYQKVEYIATTNKAYINTGLTLTNEPLRIQTKIYTLSNADNSNAFNVRRSTSAGGLAVALFNAANGSGLEFITGNGTGNFHVNSGLSNLTNKTVELEATLTGGNLNDAVGTLTTSLNGAAPTTVTNSGKSFDNSMAPLCLWGNMGIPNVGAGYNGRIYYFKVWLNDVLKLDMVPCYRIADGVIGMYDFVSQSFKTNAGSGSFTKGSDI